MPWSRSTFPRTVYPIDYTRQRVLPIRTPSLGLCCLGLAALLPLVAGCVRLGVGIGRAPLPDGAPDIAEILADLAQAEASISTVRAAGSFLIESPDFDAVRRFRGGRVMFRRPEDLFVQGNHRVTNIPLFKLISVGKEFLIEFPTNLEKNYYRLEGETFEDVPFAISPSDIAREIFFAESWGSVGRRQARVVDFGSDRESAIVEIGPRDRPRRRLEVTRINPGNPVWIISENRRLGENGEIYAITTLSDYRLIDAIYFPAKMDVRFPGEGARMTFEMRNIRINTELPDEVFDVRARARELNLGEPEDGAGDQRSFMRRK